MSVLNLANKISIARIILIPFFVAAVIYGRHDIALAVFGLAAISDGLDGFIARTFRQKTALGMVLDPVADKLLLVTAYILLAMTANLPAALRLPPYVPIVVISRDVIIVLGSVIVYLMKGDLKVSPSILGKVTTFFQMVTIVSVLIYFSYSWVLWNVTVLLTIVSGIDYIRRGAHLLGEAHAPAAKG